MNTLLTKVYVRFSSWLINIEDLDNIINSSLLLKDNEFYLKELVRKNKYVLSKETEEVIAKMKLTSSIAWANFKNQVTSNHKYI